MGKLLLDLDDYKRLTGHEFGSRPAPVYDLSRPADGYVYLLEYEATYKIGISRFGGLRRSNQIAQQHKLSTCPKLICEMYVDDMRALEAELHERFADKRVNGEWFALAPEDVAYIKSLGASNG